MYQEQIGPGKCQTDICVKLLFAILEDTESSNLPFNVVMAGKDAKSGIYPHGSSARTRFRLRLLFHANMVAKAQFMGSTHMNVYELFH